MHTFETRVFVVGETFPYIDGQLVFNKGATTIQWGRTVFLTGGAGTIGYPHAEE